MYKERVDFNHLDSLITTEEIKRATNDLSADKGHGLNKYLLFFFQKFVVGQDLIQLGKDSPSRSSNLERIN